MLVNSASPSQLRDEWGYTYALMYGWARKRGLLGALPEESIDILRSGIKAAPNATRSKTDYSSLAQANEEMWDDGDYKDADLGDMNEFLERYDE